MPRRTLKGQSNEVMRLQYLGHTVASGTRLCTSMPSEKSFVKYGTYRPFKFFKTCQSEQLIV